MKKNRLYSLILFPLISACGGAISDSQDFVPNKVPVFARVSPLLWKGGSLYEPLSADEKTTLISNMTFILEIEAADPENEGISYSYLSEQGTFTPQDVTATGTSAYFVTAEELSAGEAVVITVTATDPIGDSSEKILELGTVKPVPTLNASFSSTSSVTTGTFALTGDPLKIYLSADCDGQYQARISASSAASPGMDYSSFVWDYSKGDPAEIVISSSSEKCKITEAGPYFIWVIFVDAIGQETAKCVTITATE
ncbi:MAG: hypothetical protein ACRCUT_05655 [Spirochaetota bacterium]